MAAYTLTRESLGTITDVEMAFGTTKLLPAYEQVPAEFKGFGDRHLPCGVDFNV